MISSKDVRAKLKAGQPTMGTWLQIPSPDIAEIIGRMGYDWAAVDMEHGAVSRSQLPDIFRALERWGTLPFVRLPENNRHTIKAALDSGAKGLVFPMIENRAQLDELIALSLYPGGAEFTSGRRGVGFSRANAFGLDFAEHTNANGLGHDLVLVAQIEHADALPHLEAIFAHPRLDAYMVGPYDLSASLGITGRFEHPKLKETLALIEAKANAAGIAKGYHVVQPDPQALRDKIKDGYTFLAYGIDTLFLMENARCPKI